MNNRTRIIIFTFFFFCFLAQLGFSEAKSKSQLRYKIDSGTKVEINNKNGSIRINDWSRSYVQVEATMFSWAWEGSEELKKVKIVAESEGNTFIIRTDYQVPINKVPVYLEINIPESTYLKSVSNNNGEVRIEGCQGDLELHTTNGRIRIDNFNGFVKAETTNSNIEVDMMKGEGQFKTTNGRVKITDSTGPMTAETTNGYVDINNVYGNVKVTVNSGNIDMDDIRGDQQLTTSSGKIEVDDCTGNLVIHTNYGNIDVDNVNGLVDAETSNGRIKIRDVKAIIRAVTNNGKIDVEMRKIDEQGSYLLSRNGTIEVKFSYSIQANLEIYCPIGTVDIGDIHLKMQSSEDGRQIGILRKGGPLIYIESSVGNIELKDL
ncbi:MAG: DUF4097 domain-containing protein [Spirochaetes bacterium]|nr:DUF4097 domain-containing protein [Spirochaetota bacterium]